MSRELAVRAGMLYLPAMAALLAGLGLRQPKRQFAACLLSSLWTLPALLLLQRLNIACGWWSFPLGGPAVLRMPLEAWLGWTVLWGLLPQLAMQRVPLRWCVLTLAALDLVTMPLCFPVLWLSPRWLWGEGVAVAMVLLPSLCIARWTLKDRHLPWRAATQVITAAMVFLYLPEETALVLRGGAGWSALFARPRWQLELLGLLLFLCALPGVSAVQEFAQRGPGTPLPYDPPRRLVTSGIYRYCANPMQLGCTVTMLAWAALLWNAWLLVPAALSVAYSAGIAAWDEDRDLEQRFGPAHRRYRAAVPSWRYRALPYVGGEPARLYLAASCGPCSELRRWLEAREPLGLELRDAEELPGDSIDRMRYVAEGQETEGARALGRAFEHLHLGWAILGAAMRLPLLWQLAQALGDASGFGPREVAPCAVPPQRSM